MAVLCLVPTFDQKPLSLGLCFFKIGLLVHSCFGPILNFFQLGLTLVWVCISKMGWPFFKKPFVGRYKPILGSVFKPNMRLACIDPPSSLDPADFLGGEIRTTIFCWNIYHAPNDQKTRQLFSPLHPPKIFANHNLTVLFLNLTQSATIFLMMKIRVRRLIFRSFLYAAQPPFQTNQRLSYPVIRFTLLPFLYHPNPPPFFTILNLLPFQLSPTLFYFFNMDEILASLWNSLSIADNEALTLNIADEKLSLPKFALVGKLAMKKFVSVAKVDRGLKS